MTAQKFNLYAKLSATCTAMLGECSTFSQLPNIVYCRPLIQCKLEVLSRAGLAKEDFSKADSTVMKVKLGLCLWEAFNDHW